MENSVEYQILIGCNDSQTHNELVGAAALREMVAQFFERRQIDFSMLNAEGGYLHENGWFVAEHSLCINIIGDSDLDIVKLAKSLSMFMNQESCLITRNTLSTKIL